MYIKKYILLILLIFILDKVHSQNYKKYKVLNIDSTSNNYLIYLKKNNHKLIVISPKSDSIIDDKIIVGKEYKLNLMKSSLNEFLPNSNISHSLSVEDKLIWKDGDDINVYFTYNLIGLYYISETR